MYRSIILLNLIILLANCGNKDVFDNNTTRNDGADSLDSLRIELDIEIPPGKMPLTAAITLSPSIGDSVYHPIWIQGENGSKGKYYPKVPHASGGKINYHDIMPYSEGLEKNSVQIEISVEQEDSVIDRQKVQILAGKKSGYSLAGEKSELFVFSNLSLRKT